MSSSLSNKINYWKWSDTLHKEFNDLKKAINNMKSVAIPDYKKDFIRKTDTSNEGLGAALMQERNGKRFLIQWASKKPTATKSRYLTSGKEMLAVFWIIKKFDYELTRRKFRLITNHKALVI